MKLSNSYGDIKLEKLFDTRPVLNNQKRARCRRHCDCSERIGRHQGPHCPSQTRDGRCCNNSLLPELAQLLPAVFHILDKDLKVFSKASNQVCQSLHGSNDCRRAQELDVHRLEVVGCLLKRLGQFGEVFIHTLCRVDHSVRHDFRCDLSFRTQRLQLANGDAHFSCKGFHDQRKPLGNRPELIALQPAR